MEIFKGIVIFQELDDFQFLVFILYFFLFFIVDFYFVVHDYREIGGLKFLLFKSEMKMMGNS